VFYGVLGAICEKSRDMRGPWNFGGCAFRYGKGVWDLVEEDTLWEDGTREPLGLSESMKYCTLLGVRMSCMWNLCVMFRLLCWTSSRSAG